MLIRVRAFGINRSELFTRQGHSPSVTFPRVLGIEAVGTVEAAPGGEFTTAALPTGVCLTAYHVGKVFHLDEIVEAHRTMEENRAGGKIVVLT